MHAFNRSSQVSTRRGLTLIELLVVISILAILLALLIPAVMSSRQSALRLECSNQLKQVELATIQYHEVYSAYPAYFSTGTAQRGMVQVAKFYSVFGRIAPYLEQQSLYNQINFEVELLDPVTTNNVKITDPGYDFGSPANFTVMAASLAVLVCPADPSRPTPGGTKGSNYRANYGSSAGNGLDQNLTGPFSFRSTLSASGITDGLSQTAAYAEKPRGDAFRTTFNSFVDPLVNVMNPDPPESYPFQYCANQTIIPANYRTTTGINWLVGGLTQTCYNHLEVPNGTLPDCVRLNYLPGMARSTARSYHGAGANVALADGSVHFMSGTINSAVWTALGTHAGGETFQYANW